MAVRRLNHAVLYVSDVPRAVAFYTGALGFTVTAAYGDGAAFLASPDSANDHDLGLFQATPGSPPPAGGAIGLYHLAWEVGTVDELAELATSLRDRGALVGASDHHVSLSLYAKDPDGIEFEVMWRVPEADRPDPATVTTPTKPLDLHAAIARWGGRLTGAAAGSVT